MEVFREFPEQIAEETDRKILLVSRQLQDAPCPDHPGVAGGEPSRGRAVFSADLLAASQSGGTAMGLGPAAGPSRAEQDRSTASRQPGSCFSVFARSSGTGAGLLARGRLPVYSCLHSEDPTFDAISGAHRAARGDGALENPRPGTPPPGLDLAAEAGTTVPRVDQHPLRTAAVRDVRGPRALRLRGAPCRLSKILLTGRDPTLGFRDPTLGFCLGRYGWLLRSWRTCQPGCDLEHRRHLPPASAHSRLQSPCTPLWRPPQPAGRIAYQRRSTLALNWPRPQETPAGSVRN